MASELRRHLRQNDIVNAAYLALLKHGLPTLSYDRIAEEGDLSRQLIKYHFPNSEDLMLALCDHIALLYRTTLVTLAREAQGKDRINIFFDFYFDLLEGSPKPRDDQIYDALLSLSTASPNIRDKLNSHYTLLQNVLSQELQVSYPELPVHACENLGYLFVSIMYGHWKMVASLGFQEGQKFVARDAIERLLTSYVEEVENHPQIDR